MPEKDNPGMGERIQSMVEDAINSMDFEQLNKNITGSIQSVFEELNIQPPAGTRSKVSSTPECEISLRYREEDRRAWDDQVCEESAGHSDRASLHCIRRCVYRHIWHYIHCDGCCAECGPMLLLWSGHITLSLTIPSDSCFSTGDWQRVVSLSQTG